MKEERELISWQEKAAILNGLATISLLIRKPGDWYVKQRVEVKHGPMLTSSSGAGTTPEEAVEAHWFKLTKGLRLEEYLVVDASNDRRRAVRWNGYMWKDVAEPKPKD